MSACPPLDFSIIARPRTGDRLAKRLGSLKHILRGSIVRHGNICGKAVCICKRKDNPVLHGPYSYLSHRSRGVINTVFLNSKKLPIAQKGIKEYDEAIELIYKIAEINLRILMTFGNRSEKGEHNHEVIMSLIQTARLQNINPLPFLRALLTDHKKAATVISTSVC